MNDSHPRELLSSTASIVLSLWFSFSGLAAVTGNAAVLWLFCKNDSFRTISNRYLASLSVADLSVGLFVDPLWIVIRCWIKPEISTVFLSTTLYKCCGFTPPPPLLSTFAVFPSTGLFPFGFLSVIRTL